MKSFNLNLPRLVEETLPTAVKELIKSLCNSSYEIYLIGGFIRDALLGINTFDLDFVVIDVNIEVFCKELLSSHNGSYFYLDEETQTIRVSLNDEESKLFSFDFTRVPKIALDADFERRDFTIDALAVSLKNPNYLIDKFNGLDDLKKRKIRAIKLENLLEDPLRFLRAFRIACQIKGEVDNRILTFIQENINYFQDSIPKERIGMEIWKIFDSDNSFSYVKLISETSLLEKIIPELTSCRKVPPNNFHHLGLYDHSVELIKTFEENYSKFPDWVQEDLNKPFGSLSFPTKKAVSKFACLLHDIGKPQTWEIKNIDGREKHTFYGHDKLGAELTGQIGARLRFSNSIIQTLSKLVRYHLRPFQLSQNNMPITQRALFRFFRDLEEELLLLLALAMADSYATCGPEITNDDLKQNENLLLFLTSEYKKYKEEKETKKIKLLDGNEIMNITGIKPGPELGRLIKELDEEIGIGVVKTKEEALEWVKGKCRMTNDE